jgi:hypothetical protein
MTWGVGRLAWIVAGVLLAVSLYEFAEPDFGSGAGLFIFFLILFFVVRRYKLKW